MNKAFEDALTDLSVFRKHDKKADDHKSGGTIQNIKREKYLLCKSSVRTLHQTNYTTGWCKYHFCLVKLLFEDSILHALVFRFHLAPYFVLGYIPSCKCLFLLLHLHIFSPHSGLLIQNPGCWEEITLMVTDGSFYIKYLCCKFLCHTIT